MVECHDACCLSGVNKCYSGAFKPRMRIEVNGCSHVVCTNHKTAINGRGGKESEKAKEWVSNPRLV